MVGPGARFHRMALHPWPRQNEPTLPDLVDFMDRSKCRSKNIRRHIFWRAPRPAASSPNMAGRRSRRRSGRDGKFNSPPRHGGYLFAAYPKHERSRAPGQFHFVSMLRMGRIDGVKFERDAIFQKMRIHPPARLTCFEDVRHCRKILRSATPIARRFPRHGVAVEQCFHIATRIRRSSSALVSVRPVISLSHRDCDAPSPVRAYRTRGPERWRAIEAASRRARPGFYW